MNQSKMSYAAWNDGHDNASLNDIRMFLVSYSNRYHDKHGADKNWSILTACSDIIEQVAKEIEE